eukprot:scaffold431_cov334-Pavlova_lutheri.AAC.121
MELGMPIHEMQKGNAVYSSSYPHSTPCPLPRGPAPRWTPASPPQASMRHRTVVAVQVGGYWDPWLGMVTRCRTTAGAGCVSKAAGDPCHL